MEFWARWAHRALWHAQLWQMHEVNFHLLPYFGAEMSVSFSQLEIKIEIGGDHRFLGSHMEFAVSPST